MTDEHLDWQDSLQRLIDGNERFVRDEPLAKLPGSDIRQALITGQSPYACILTCSDSRVVPEFIFDTGLGDLFVVRVAGNVPNMSSVGSIEIAVTQLGVKLIVVLAHENCNAVLAAVESKEISPNTNHLMGFISDSISPGLELESIIKQNARNTAKELCERSDFIHELHKSDPRFKIVPAYYHLGSGHVEFLT